MPVTSLAASIPNAGFERASSSAISCVYHHRKKEEGGELEIGFGHTLASFFAYNARRRGADPSNTSAFPRDTLFRR